MRDSKIVQLKPVSAEDIKDHLGSKTINLFIMCVRPLSPVICDPEEEEVISVFDASDTSDYTDLSDIEDVEPEPGEQEVQGEETDTGRIYKLFRFPSDVSFDVFYENKGWNTKVFVKHHYGERSSSGIEMTIEGLYWINGNLASNRGGYVCFADYEIKMQIIQEHCGEEYEDVAEYTDINICNEFKEYDVGLCNTETLVLYQRTFQKMFKDLKQVEGFDFISE